MKYLDEQTDTIDYTFISGRIRRNNIRQQAYNGSQGREQSQQKNRHVGLY
jgi:hypothetical protein